MRSVFYVTALVYMLACLLAFATVPAVAQTTSNQEIPKIGPMMQHSGPVENPGEMGFSAQAKGGTDLTSQTKRSEDMKSAKVYSHTKPGEATVARVDKSGNCLHVYTDPSVSSKEIACLLKGETIHLTGLFTKDKRWAQLDNKGWVLHRNLKTHVKARRTAASNMSWGRPAAMGKGTSKNGLYNPKDHELNWGPIF